MKIHNVIEIHEGREYVTIMTIHGAAIHLPIISAHSINILNDETPKKDYSMTISIDIYDEENDIELNN